ncbi:MAG TPA: fibronectin type III domain-containing protein [Candidatus Thermoplasmatota archaeon]|nr:fibronectin type III domain-containing protein [Candidatus Thermoplasmatota archaeon]
MRFPLLLVTGLTIAALAGCTAPCPAGVTATATASGQVLVSWEAVEGAEGYFIVRSVDGGPAELYDAANATAEPSYTDTNVTAGHTYAYSVMKVGEGTFIDDCPATEVRVPDASVPFFGIHGLALGLAGALVGSLLVLLRRR